MAECRRQEHGEQEKRGDATLTPPVSKAKESENNGCGRGLERTRVSCNACVYISAGFGRGYFWKVTQQKYTKQTS